MPSQPSHTTDEANMCLERCAHPAHDGPLIYAIPPDFKPLLDEWLLSLGVVPKYAPSDPADDDPVRMYAVVVAGTPAEAATRPGALDTLLRERGSRAAAKRVAETPRRLRR